MITFPKFSHQFRNHMPFCAQCNNQMIYMCCTSIANGIWKVFYNINNSGWIRLTNSQNNVIECNPSIYYANNKYHVSYIKKVSNNLCYLNVLVGESLNSLITTKSQPMFTGFELNGKIYKASGSDIKIIQNEKITSTYTIKNCQLIYRLTYNPLNTNEIIATVMADNKTTVYLIKNFQQIFKLTSDQPLYKVFKYGDEYWSVFKLNNSSNQDLRTICKINCEMEQQ